MMSFRFLLKSAVVKEPFFAKYHSAVRSSWSERIGFRLGLPLAVPVRLTFLMAPVPWSTSTVSDIDR